MFKFMWHVDTVLFNVFAVKQAFISLGHDRNPILPGDTKNTNPESIGHGLDNVGNSVSEDLFGLDVLDIAQEPWEVAALSQFDSVLLFKIKLMIAITGGIDLEGIEGLDHLPALLISG